MYIVRSLTVRLEPRIDDEASTPMGASFFGDEKIMQPESAEAGSIGHVAVGPGGSPTHDRVPLLVRERGDIGRDGEDAPAHEIGDDLTHEGLAEYLSKEPRLRPPLGCPLGLGSVIFLGLSGDRHDERDYR